MRGRVLLAGEGNLELFCTTRSRSALTRRLINIQSRAQGREYILLTVNLPILLVLYFS